jgi:hypothetical protein
MLISNRRKNYVRTDWIESKIVVRKYLIYNKIIRFISITSCCYRESTFILEHRIWTNHNYFFSICSMCAISLCLHKKKKKKVYFQIFSQPVGKVTIEMCAALIRKTKLESLVCLTMSSTTNDLWDVCTTCAVEVTVQNTLLCILTRRSSPYSSKN